MRGRKSILICEYRFYNNKTIGLSLLNYLAVNFPVKNQDIVFVSDDFCFLNDENYFFPKRIFIKSICEKFSHR